jgi:hypothetical protein
MSPVYLVYLANVRKALSRKVAEGNYSFKQDIQSDRKVKAPIIA